MERPARFFTPSQVAAHNVPADLWLSFLGKVCDLSPLVRRYRGDVLLLPILEAAGSDISSWFDPETKDPLTFVDPVTCCVSYYSPRGRYLHLPPAGPRSDWGGVASAPWWRDSSFQVGRLTAKTRSLRIVNTLTSQELTLQVCSEETLEAVLQRYLPYNGHAHSYTWKHGGAALDMKKTLEENGVRDQDDELETLRTDPERHVTTLLLHYNDDLTED